MRPIRALLVSAAAGTLLLLTAAVGLRSAPELPRQASFALMLKAGLFVALIGNGFNLLGLDPFYQQVTLGVILLLAVGVDAWTRRFE
mgnify:CR=1 FL=1